MQKVLCFAILARRVLCAVSRWLGFGVRVEWSSSTLYLSQCANARTLRLNSAHIDVVHGENYIIICLHKPHKSRGAYQECAVSAQQTYIHSLEIISYFGFLVPSATRRACFVCLNHAWLFCVYIYIVNARTPSKEDKDFWPPMAKFSSQ